MYDPYICIFEAKQSYECINKSSFIKITGSLLVLNKTTKYSEGESKSTTLRPAFTQFTEVNLPTFLTLSTAFQKIHPINKCIA